MDDSTSKTEKKIYKNFDEFCTRFYAESGGEVADPGASFGRDLARTVVSELSLAKTKDS